MKRTICNLIVAAPLTMIALTVTPSTAMAFDPMPIGTPTPDPDPGPGDISDKPNPPKPPQGPGDLAIPKPVQPKPNQPKPAQPTANTGGQQADGQASATDTDAGPGKTESAVTVPDACLIHDLECNAAAPVEKVSAATPQGDPDGMDLTWLLAGGAIVSATGVAFAARKHSRSNA